MHSSLHGESVVLVWLLVGLAVMVAGQLVAGWLWGAPPSVPRGRWDVPVFAAPGVALGGMLASVLVLVPWGVLNTFVLHLHKGSLPDAFWLPWLATWSLLPCVVVGYRSGRWWSFSGAAPVLVLFPLGTVFASGPADWFLTLPVTAAVAVALSLGSALRSVRCRGGSVRQHRALSI